MLRLLKCSKTTGVFAALCLPFLLATTVLSQTVTTLTLKPPSVFGGEPSAGTVKLSKVAGASGFVVSLTSSKSSVTVPPTVTVPAGTNIATFSIATSPVTVFTTSAITASGGGGSASSNLSLKLPNPLSVTFSPSKMGGGAPANGTLTLTSVAATGGVSVSLKSDSTLVKVPASVVVPAGSNSVSFTAPTSRTAVNVTATITATRAGVSVTGPLTILPVGLDLSSPWAKFHGDAANTGYSPNGAASGDWTSSIGSPVLSSPCVGLDGTIYVGANNGYVYALKATDGTQLWKFKTGSRVVSSPVITKTGVLFVGSADRSVYAIDTTTGIKIWSYKTGGAVTSTPCIGSEGSLYMGSFDGNIYALDQQTGAKLWSYKTGGAVTSSPNLSSLGILYVGSNDHSLYAIDTLTHAKVWSYQTGSDVHSSPALANGKVYFGSYDGYVYALDQATGALVWSFLTDWTVYSSPCVDAAGTVYIGSDDANVYALDGTTGALKWSYLTDDCVGSSPAVDLSGRVWVGSDDGNLYALNASTAAVELKYTQGSRLESSPATGSNSAFVGTEDGKVRSKTTFWGGTGRIFFDAQDDSSLGGGIYSVFPDGSGITKHVSLASGIWYPYFVSPNGQTLYSRSNNTTANCFDTIGIEDKVVGLYTPPITGVVDSANPWISANQLVLNHPSGFIVLDILTGNNTFFESGPVNEWGCTPLDATHVVTGSQVQGGNALYVTDTITGLSTLVPTTGVGSIWPLSYNASSNYVYCQASYSNTNNWDIWRVHPDGTGLVNLTNVSAGVIAFAPSVSPDGTQVAFIRQTTGAWWASGSYDLCVMNADGSNLRTILSGNNLFGTRFTQHTPIVWVKPH